MAGLIDLFGDVLLTKAGLQPTSEALAGATGIAIYFSAHWCPPCRGFTPKLAGAWKETYDAKGMKVVFVSSDRDESAFNEYFGEQPWLAVPYGDRQRKDTLSKKFKVQGIPTLVMLSPSGELITENARGKIDEPGSYPWIPPTFAQVMDGAEIVDSAGAAGLEAGKPLGLYFSAHWCPPCRGFTPQLAKWYTEGLREKMEILFVSSDRSEEDFKSYFAEMPWKALSFAQREKKSQLSDMFGVSGIPSFVVLDSDGKTITTDGRSKVSADPRGATFPAGWLPQPVNDANDDPSDLNSETCFLVLDPSAASKEALMTVAKEHEAAAGGVSAMEFRFFTCSGGQVGDQIKKLTKTESMADSLLVLDLPAGGKYKAVEGEVTAESIRGAIEKHRKGELEMATIER